MNSIRLLLLAGGVFWGELCLFAGRELHPVRGVRSHSSPSGAVMKRSTTPTTPRRFDTRGPGQGVVHSSVHASTIVNSFHTSSTSRRSEDKKYRHRSAGRVPTNCWNKGYPVRLTEQEVVARWSCGLNIKPPDAKRRWQLYGHYPEGRLDPVEYEPSKRRIACRFASCIKT